MLIQINMTVYPYQKSIVSVNEMKLFSKVSELYGLKNDSVHIEIHLFINCNLDSKHKAATQSEFSCIWTLYAHKRQATSQVLLLILS